MGGATAIVLAAQREGRLDPLAAAAGVSHKCLVPIGGRPLIAHVVETLSRSAGIARLRISAEPEAQGALRIVLDRVSIPIEFVPARASITDSVEAAASGCEGPFVITTADNVLLTEGAVAKVAAALASGADGVVALSRKESVLRAHPHGQRRFYRLRDGEFSNCNLYGLSRAGLRMAETFREGGQFAKRPMRIVKAVGPLNLVILHYGLITLDRAMIRLGRRFGLRAEAIVLEDGAHAIDVDNERTYAIAQELLEKRAA